MTQEEWLKEFERLNGRPATQEEFEQGFAAFAQQAQQQVQQVQPQAQQAAFGGVPAPKKSKTPWIIGGIVGVIALVAIVLGTIFFLNKSADGSNQSMGINGDWHLSNKDELSSLLPSDLEGLNSSELMDALDVSLNVKGETFSMTINMDLKKLLEVAKKENSFPDSVSDDQLYDMLESQMETSLESASSGSGMKVSVDKNNHVVNLQIAEKGKIDTKKKELTIPTSDSAVSYELDGDTLILKADDGQNLKFTKK